MILKNLSRSNSSSSATINTILGTLNKANFGGKKVLYVKIVPTLVIDLVSFSIILLTTPACEAASSRDCNRSCTTSIVLSAAVSMLSWVCLGAYNIKQDIVVYRRSVHTLVYCKDLL